MDSISYWLDLPYTPRAVLEHDEEADVVVIGGGITGISTAYHCAQQGLKTILIEKDTIASGPAGRNGGMVVEGRSIDFANTVKKVGVDAATREWRDTMDARELVAKLVDTHSIDCDFSRPGSLYIGASDEDTNWLRTEAAARQAAGIPCEILEEGEQLKDTTFTAALFAPDDCALHPVKFLRTLAGIAENLGAIIYENTIATSFDAQSVTTPYGVVRAKYVVVATEADNSSPMNTVRIVRSQAVVTEPLSAEVVASLNWTKGGMLWTTEDTEYASVRKIGNRLFICKGLPLDPTADDLEQNKQWQLGKLRSFFPDLPADIGVTHQWTCRMLEADENHPYIGMRNGWYEALGHGGNGLTNGVMAGKMLAEHFSGAPIPAPYAF